MPCQSDIENIETSNTTVSVEADQCHTKHISPPQEKLLAFVQDFINEINAKPSLTKDAITKIVNTFRRIHKIAPSKYNIRTTLQEHFSDTVIPTILEKWLVKSAVGMNSGVLVVTITLAPSKFSCKYDCSYCPQETDRLGNHTQPRSYISTEPAMLRGLAADFDIKKQFISRVKSYIYTGSIKTATQSYKMEVRLVGGTWESYPLEYRDRVMNELYWAANTIYQDRPMRTLSEEIEINETARYLIVGLTIETRPDNITPESIRDYCRWGVTRVEIGVQHFNDIVLKKNNRKCYLVDTIRAIRLLKQCGFKVHVHLMPDLPGSAPELDMWMFDQALRNPDLQFDDVKLYTCAVMKSASDDLIVKSKIADWYAAGTYTPYSESNVETLIEVLKYYKRQVQPWTRIVRLIRDIPGKSIEAGYNKISNLRQVIHTQMGDVCKCIFCKEIGDGEADDLEPILVVRRYEASKGIEYFISSESHIMSYKTLALYYFWYLTSLLRWLFTGYQGFWDGGNNSSYNKIFGFLRLRIDPNPGGVIISEINDCALIREVHVYGQALGVNHTANSSNSTSSQHRGFGKQLVSVAETISSFHEYKKIAVIAGVGTREYYKNKCGFTKGSTYMLKKLEPLNYYTLVRSFSIVTLLAVLIFGSKAPRV
jgi:ELP3 family radical SAM enzyme/protein acetyltransferase